MADHKQIAHKPDPTRLPKPVSGWTEYQDGTLFYDGDQLIVAMPLVGHGDSWYYKFEVVTVRCDEDYFSVEDCNGDSWGWELCDCDYYSKLA